jgi:SnoaL-like domain
VSAKTDIGHMFDAVKTSQGTALRSALERFYRHLFEKPDTLPNFLADTCVQHVGRLALNYPEIVKHVMHVRSSVQEIQYSVEDAIAHGDTIADRHLVELTLHDGRSAVLEVLCFMRIANGKIAELYESSQILSGDDALGALATASG